MLSAIQHFDYRSTYQSAANSTKNIFQKSTTWISNQGGRLASNLSKISEVAKTRFSSLSQGVSSTAEKIKNFCQPLFTRLSEWGSTIKRHSEGPLKDGGSFLWKHRATIGGGIVIGAVLYTIYYLWKNRVQYPIVKFQTTLNIAKLSISVPKKEHVIPNVSLVFCVDTSSSMAGEPEKAVKRALSLILPSAQKAVDAGKAQIEMAIVAFAQNSEFITQPIKLVANRSTTDTILNQLNALPSGESTEIIQGLTTATNALEYMSQQNPNAKPTLVLLSNGDQSITAKSVHSLHERFSKIDAQVFGIGIGLLHNTNTMDTITKSSTFSGTYINTADDTNEIEKAIMRIYEQAVSTFHQIELTCPQLPEGSWSVLHTPSLSVHSQSKFQLGTIGENERMEKTIVLHGEKLAKSLDLNKISFNLEFTDPNGRKGLQKLRWKPNTSINPDVLND